MASNVIESARTAEPGGQSRRTLEAGSRPTLEPGRYRCG